MRCWFSISWLFAFLWDGSRAAPNDSDPVADGHVEEKEKVEPLEEAMNAKVEAGPVGPPAEDAAGDRCESTTNTLSLTTQTPVGEDLRSAGTSYSADFKRVDSIWAW